MESLKELVSRFEELGQENAFRFVGTLTDEQRDALLADLHTISSDHFTELQVALGTRKTERPEIQPTEMLALKKLSLIHI